MNFTFKHISKYKLTLLDFAISTRNIAKSTIISVKKCNKYIDNMKVYKIFYSVNNTSATAALYVLETSLNVFEVMHLSKRKYECVTCIRNVNNDCNCICAD